MASLQGTAIGAKIVPFDSADTYPTHDDIYGHGGYVSINDNISIEGINEYIPLDRRKIGQIIYLSNLNKHYTITTLNNPLSFYDLKPALPHEYDGSFLSTSFVAKTSTFEDRNVISSYVGQQWSFGNVWDIEAYEHSSILGGSNNKLYRSLTSYLRGTNLNTTIVGGSGNIVDYSNYGLVGGGDRNQHISSNHSTILGGSQNILRNAPWSIVGGGRANILGGAGGSQWFNVIVGGESNNLLGQYNFIGGGKGNNSRGNYNAIVGGENNQSLGINDIVVGGKSNETLGSPETGTLLYGRQYTELVIDPNYILDTKIMMSGRSNSVPISNQTLIEVIPGASCNGVTNAGIVRLYSVNNTIEASTEGCKTLGATISGTIQDGLLGLGTGARIIFSCKNDNRYGLFLGEPGNNTLYFYSLTSNNPNEEPTLLQTFDIGDVDPLANVDSKFGYSVAYVQRGFEDFSINSNNTGSPFNMLFVGAPGNDTVYVYTSNASDPVTDGANLFTYLTKITGDSGSEFGHSITADAVWRGSLPSISAVFMCAGAPNALNPLGIRTGDAYVHFCELDENYTKSNKTFTPFSTGASITNFLYPPYSDSGTFLSAGLRIGESFSSNLGWQFNDSTPAIKEQSETNVEDLSSYDIRIYFNIPNASVNYFLGVDTENENRLTYQSFSFDLDSISTNPDITTLAVSSAGVWFGSRTNFIDSNTPNFNRWWGSFTMFGQTHGFERATILEGPQRLYSGIYSKSSILNSTNLEVYDYFVKTGSRLNFSYSFRSNSYNPVNYNSSILSYHPGMASYGSSVANSDYTHVYLPYPSNSYNNIRNYGFLNYHVPSTNTSAGLFNVYYLSGGILTNAIITNDLPGQTTTACTILGGNNNSIAARSSTIVGGTNNNISAGTAVGLIVGGNQNNLIDTTGDTNSKLYNSVIQGSTNTVDGTQYSTILNGSNNIINKYADNSAILGGSNNTINTNISACYVLGLSLTGNKPNTVFIENLKAIGHIEAKTKSFTIKHPTKEGKTLTYGSLESPYHGIRLTGFDKVVNGTCVVKLPGYTYKLVDKNNINIQLTNYKHSKILYVDSIDILNNKFIVKTDSLLKNIFNYEFFWSFTAIRTDVPEIQVES